MSINGFKDQLAVISETKLLEVILTNDLKWAETLTKMYERKQELGGLGH